MSKAANSDSFGAKSTLDVNGKSYEIYRLGALKDAGIGKIDRLPFSLRVLLENLLRNENGGSVTAEQIKTLAGWDVKSGQQYEIAYHPARVLMQDFTGVPAVVDLAAMRDALHTLGGDPAKINPQIPVDLVIDHSVMVDHYASPEAYKQNVELEYQRNNERYTFLRWGQQAFENFRVVPPGTGICHQVNLEYLAKCVWTAQRDGKTLAYPDTCVGTDSHTTMINGLAVMGWGVGGIEAEAAMLGQPVTMLIPDVVGFKFTGALQPGITATDLVLTCVQMLRELGVVGKFVEYFGPGLANLTVADRATIANMGPEYGATMGFFPVDDATLQFLRFTNRSDDEVALVEAYTKENFLFRTDDAHPEYTTLLELDLSTVEPSIAGPKRPQDRIGLKEAKPVFRKAMHGILSERGDKVPQKELSRWAGEGGNTQPPEPVEPSDPDRGVEIEDNGVKYRLNHGDVVIGAITSCTNTSNPSVLLGAGLLAKKAAAKGLTRKPWVKTSLAPGSQVVTDYLNAADVMQPLEALGFHLVGYGCTTCIGNSGPLPLPQQKAVEEDDLVLCSVLSGNRNFEGRIGPHVRMNYLASPPLVVAYSLAGRMDFDFETDPLGKDQDGNPVMLKDLWPTGEEIQDAIDNAVTKGMFAERYAAVFDGDEMWRGLDVPDGDRYTWPAESTYIQNPPYFVGMTVDPGAMLDVKDARVLAKLGDSITTDHISPAGSFKPEHPAGKYLVEKGVDPQDFNSYGSRRGNHEVMMRGTFANVRLRNQLAPGTEGGITRKLPEGDQTTIYDAAMEYMKQGVPLVVLAGKEYGTGSSRDWAAKGTNLLGVKAVIAQSFERIHRSNLVGMGVLPLQFADGDSIESLGLTGEEKFSISGVTDLQPGALLTVSVVTDGGDTKTFSVKARIDTPQELEYYRHGGILQYVLRQLKDA